MLMQKENSALLMIDVQEKLTPHVQASQQLTSACAWLGRLAMALDVPILISEQYPSGLGQTIADLAFMKNEKNCVEKVHFSCFCETAYQNQLKIMEKTDVILAGIESHVCVLQSAMELKAAGYRVFVVADAVSSRSQYDKDMALQRMAAGGIQIVTREMVFFEWLRQAGGADFKALSKEFLQ